MPATNPTSKWRNDLAGFRQRLRHYPATEGNLYDDDRLLGLIYLAEEFISQPLLDLTGWSTAAQNSFDTAVVELCNLWIVNPDYAKKTKDDVQSRDYWDEVPFAVKTFWINYADGKYPGAKDNKPFILGRFTK